MPGVPSSYSCSLLVSSPPSNPTSSCHLVLLGPILVSLLSLIPIHGVPPLPHPYSCCQFLLLIPIPGVSFSPHYWCPIFLFILIPTACFFSSFAHLLSSLPLHPHCWCALLLLSPIPDVPPPPNPYFWCPLQLLIPIPVVHSSSSFPYSWVFSSSSSPILVSPVPPFSHSTCPSSPLPHS